MIVGLAIEDARWYQHLPQLPQLTVRCSRMVSNHLLLAPVEVGIRAVNDAAQQQLNHTYRGKDAATNVLSFPSDIPELPDMPHYLGDISLAFDTMQRESTDAGIELHAHSAHLLIHGLLHLAGYEHGTDPDAVQMESLEIMLLARMAIANPYAAR